MYREGDYAYGPYDEEPKRVLMDEDDDGWVWLIDQRFPELDLDCLPHLHMASQIERFVAEYQI